MKPPRIFVALAFLISFLPLFAQDASTNAVAAPPISEEARKHFVMGETMFKEAKSPDGFSQAAGEFSEAARLAPQWPEARYNLALAKEAAGDLSGTMADLKLYQQFKLSDAEARTVQDKIYAIEAKQKMKADEVAKKQADEQKAVVEAEQKKRDYQTKFGFLEGEWNDAITMHCDCTLDGQTLWHDVETISISDKTILMTRKGASAPWLKGTIQGDDYNSIKWVESGAPTLSDDVTLPDYPVKLTVDKSGSKIYFDTPPKFRGKVVSWSQDKHQSHELTR